MAVTRNKREVLLKRIVFLFSFFLFPFSFSLVSAQDYSKFLHTSSKHAALGCNDCHRRTDNSTRPSFPGHKACTGCHLTQFTTPNIPMCSICHENVNGNDPPRKAFPDRFKENFNMKFDHAQHLTGAARPKNGCASCHGVGLRQGAALSIPAGISAHNGCYTCHTPNAQANGRDLASCGVCHETKAYSRTSTTSTPGAPGRRGARTPTPGSSSATPARRAAPAPKCRGTARRRATACCASSSRCRREASPSPWPSSAAASALAIRCRSSRCRAAARG